MDSIRLVSTGPLLSLFLHEPSRLKYYSRSSPISKPYKRVQLLRF